MRIIIFNGPPGSGKDFIVGRLHRIIAGSMIERFSKPLKDITSDVIGSSDYMLTPYKDQNVSSYNKTYRQMQIDTFLALRSVFGEDVLGRMLVSRLRWISDLGKRTVLLPDGGRQEEVEFVANAFGKQHVLIIHVYREGHTFDRDIRSYIEVPGVTSADIYNDSTNNVVSQALKHVDTFKVK